MTKIFTYNHLKLLTGILIFVGLNLSVKAQFNLLFSSSNISESLIVRFVNPEVNVEKGQLISNVLVIQNNSQDAIEFYTTLNYPPLWKSLYKADKLYSLAAGDSVFIPVRIIPSTAMKGDTKYFINAYIEDKEHRQVSSEYFFASTERVSQWELTSRPGQRIYLKNNENTADFQIDLMNTGNEKQDILMTMATLNSNVVLLDSTGKAITDFKHDLSLKPTTDTTFSYKVKYVEGQRNFKTIDIENYNPGNLSDEKQFSVYFHSEEPRRAKHTNQSRDAKIDFIKLSNQKKANPFGSDVLPLSATLRVSNLLEDVIFSSLHLRGQKILNNGGNLIYNTSFYFSSMNNYYGNDYTRNIPWYVGYFDKTKSIQVGYVNGGAIGIQSSGKGIKAEYELFPEHRVGAFYVKSPYFFSDNRVESWGFHHKYETKNFSNLTQFSRSHQKYAKLISEVVSVSPKFRLAQRHSINFIGAYSNRYNYLNPDSSFTRNGYMAGAGYTSSFFNNIWQFNIRGTYTSKGFGTYGYERFYLNHRSRVKVSKDLEISVNNNYNQYMYDKTYYSYIPGYDKNYFFFNTVNFHSSKYLKNVKPGLFYDIRNSYGVNFHARGLNFAFNKYDIIKNLQTSFITTFGMVRTVNDPVGKENFIFKLSNMIRYRNISFTGFYNYGPLSPAMIKMKEQSNIVPQTIRASFMHMYLFKNRHVSLQSRLSYMYTNIYSHHSLNISPELFYFTNSGWRFSINPTYTFYTSQLSTNNFEFPTYITQPGEDFRRYSNDNFLISLGVKKDFGIPIPTTFDDYNNVNFVAFYDLNGNKVKDADEPGIENVVVKVGHWSIITNTDGTASILNAEPGRHSFTSMSLVDLKGWFPLTNDTLIIFKDELVYIPFVKGVKLYGSVFIEYENANILEEKHLDLSGIKISANNGHSFHTLTGPDGSFEFYLPFGDYTITLDESILNGRYYLVKNDYTLDLSKEVENMYITFHIVEKKRKVRIKKFNENGEE